MYYRRGGKRIRAGAVILILLTAAFIVSSVIFFHDLTCSIAVSDAADRVTAVVNDAISEVFGENEYAPDHFVSIINDPSGGISAIASNAAHINALSADVLNAVINRTDNGRIQIELPAGNLSGLSLLMGKGPDITVDIVMLTSSKVDFKDDIRSCGINQTKYRLILEVRIDIDVLVPWGTESTSTLTEVIVADTVIIGDVPNTYMEVGN